MKLGIVGLARSGKTTIFNTLTRREGETQGGGQVSPVPGVVSVPDLRVDWLSRLYQSKKTTYAQVTYVDLQGIPGVADNKQEYMALLLRHMRPMDAFLLVVRNFPDPASGDAADPAAQYHELADEFLIADLATVEKRLERIAAERSKGRKVSETEQRLLERCAELLNDEKPLRSRPDLAHAPELRGFTFLSAKPVLIVVNNDDDDERMPDADFGGEKALVVRGKLEMEMAQLSDEDAKAFLEDYGITETARERVIQRSYQLLDLITFLTCGEDEARAWTIPRGFPAVEAAGVIHSDIQRGFIRAEVVAFDDLRRLGDYPAARKEGLVRLEGKNYLVKDGDVINFRFNV